MCGLTIPHCRALIVHWDNLGCQEGDKCSRCDFRWSAYEKGDNLRNPYQARRWGGGGNPQGIGYGEYDRVDFNQIGRI